MARAAQERNSTTKSRSATASMLFEATERKPSSRATNFLSMGKLVPAKAAAPSGKTLMRPRQSPKRARSRSRASQWAMRWWAKETGWARWRWV